MNFLNMFSTAGKLIMTSLPVQITSAVIITASGVSGIIVYKNHDKQSAEPQTSQIQNAEKNNVKTNSNDRTSNAKTSENVQQSIDSVANSTKSNSTVKNPQTSSSSNNTSSTPTANTPAPPTVSITSPTNGQTFNNTGYMPQVFISAAASADGDGSIIKVEFLVNESIVCTDTSTPYECVWNYGTTTGAASLTARAYDNTGSMKLSDLVQINITSDTTGPTVNVTAPADGSNVSGVVSLSQTAADPHGIMYTEVRAYPNTGVYSYLVNKRCTGATTCSSNLDTTTLTNGSSIVIEFSASDLYGNNSVVKRYLTINN